MNGINYKEKCKKCGFESIDHKLDQDKMFYPFWLKCVNCGEFFSREGPDLYKEYKKVIGLHRIAAGNGTLLTWSDIAHNWMDKAIKEILILMEK